MYNCYRDCLQVILQLHTQEIQGLQSPIHLNYIETTDSVLHEMPWVVVKYYKVSYSICIIMYFMH